MDKTLSDLIKQEERRQDETLMMIPSENYTSQAVREALGSVLTNKYAEGYPGKRYYQGNKIVDEIENLAIERAKKVFNVKFANVQPYSGSPANLAIYLALCRPNETIMGMALSSGGHLTHGHKVNFSGKLFQSVQYEVGENGFLDYEAIEGLAKNCRPKIIWAGGTAYPRFFDWKKFRKIADNVGAYLAADISHYAGLVIAGVYPSPAGVADVIMTTTHKTLRGPRGAIIMTDNEELAKKIDRQVFPGLQGGPHENAIAGIAQALFEADTPEFKEYGEQVVKNAKALADELIKHGFNLVTGGTDCHLLLIDLTNKNSSGKIAAELLEEAGIIVNKNSVPNDLRPPLDPSGIRLGTPALTTRGMGEGEMVKIAKWINEAISGRNPAEIKKEVAALTKNFPLP